tara:strand:+ start:134 stop:1702 length:1569 start_codon:yes stop_codon:yes gene_type:complete
MKNLKEEIQKAVNIYKTGNLLKTEQIVKELIDQNPKMVFLYNLLGLALTGQNKIDEAINCYEKGIKIDPGYAMIYNNLGQIFYNKSSVDKNSKKYIKKAEDLYRKSILLDKKIPEPLTNLGTLYNSLNYNEESIKYHKKAIQINPNFYYAHLNLANVLISIGKLSDARKYLKESIAINPNFFHAHRLLSRITIYKKNDEHLSQLSTLYEKIEENNTEAKMILAYALGKAHEDIKDFDRSFGFFIKANSHSRKKVNFSLNDEINKFKEIKKTYTKDLLNKYKESGTESPGAIFIVGMPRSGTTLIEQILSNHTKVFGADEVEFIPNLIEKYSHNKKLNSIFKNKNILKKIGNEYLANMKEISNNLKITTDKLPINFLYLGLIKLILPKSKIIHCYRNSKDNILSIFKNYFPGKKINFAYNLNEIVSYYNLYYDLMNYWNNLLPNSIFNIKYENLVINTKEEIKNLLNFCDLEWENNCLEFYNNKRAVKTASDIQVRNKIYNTSINSWKNYRKFLDEYYVDLKY